MEQDDFDVVMKEVKAQRADLERQKEVTAQARENYEQLKQAAEAEVVKLGEIEKQRLADVAVQRELERQRQIRAEQDAAAAAAANRTAAAQLQTVAAPQPSGSSAGSSAGSSSGGQLVGRLVRRRIGATGTRTRDTRHRRTPAAASCVRSPGHGRSATPGARPARAAAATRAST